MEGERFGRWTVVSDAERNKWGIAQVFCRCDCGMEKAVSVNAIKRGVSQSCGCLRREAAKRFRVKTIAGQVFGRWTVIADAERDNRGDRQFMCRCACGEKRAVSMNALRRGDSISCGCARLEALRAAITTHGDSNMPEYHIWEAIRDRCINPNNHAARHYIGRGIRICDRWKESYVAFLEDMGRRPSVKHSIDRIDNQLGYEPENCRWATHTEQMNNTRRNHFLTFNGKTLSVSQWAKELGFGVQTLFGRIRCGLSVEQILTTPVADSKYKQGHEGYRGKRNKRGKRGI